MLQAEVTTMKWDLGFWGVALLIGMSLAFGVLAHLVLGRLTRWMGLIAAAIFFAAGVLISEVWFGWATEEELQPNIDGLSFDEVLAIGVIPGIAAVLLARWLVRARRNKPVRPHGGSSARPT
jgi:hypothetical protein